MIRLSTHHLARPAWYGPAERTLIEVWLTDLSGLNLNGYAEAPAPIAAVVPLPARRAVPALPAAQAA